MKLVPMKRVIETFVAEKLAEAPRDFLDNSDVYRAFQEEDVCKYMDELEKKSFNY